MAEGDGMNSASGGVADAVGRDFAPSSRTYPTAGAAPTQAGKRSISRTIFARSGAFEV
jgi:hypothetical protein